MKNILMIITLFYVLFYGIGYVYSANSGLFPIIKKSDACILEDGFYIGPNNGFSKLHPSQKVEYLLEIKGFPNGSTNQGFFKKGNVLSYIVTDISGIGTNYHESYYLYTYNCISKKTTTILSDAGFEKIIKKTIHPNLYTPYQILWQDSKLVNMRLDLNGIGCNDTIGDCSKTEYYEVHIQPGKRKYTLLRRNTWSEEMVNEGTFKY